MRVRGLKRQSGGYIRIRNPVAPHAGAWIETGLVFGEPFHIPVAPHAGAWIETCATILPVQGYCVAPHAGAWIETPCLWCFWVGFLSHPMRVRGLKQGIRIKTRER